MSRLFRAFSWAVYSLLLFCLVTSVRGQAGSDRRRTDGAQRSRREAPLLRGAMQAGLAFEPNRGQTDPRVRYLCRAGGYTLFLTGREATFRLGRLADPSAGGLPARQARVRMSFAGAGREPRFSGVEELPGKVNYFLGRDAARWRLEIPTFAKVRCSGLYPGVDLVYYGRRSTGGSLAGEGLEYDFIVAPGADPSRIRLAFQGDAAMEVDARGALRLRTAAGELRFPRP